jgi:hypothetical protein
MATIIFNGKTYNSLEEMSANDRQAYEQIANMLVDKDGNGIPDFLEGDLVKNVMTAFTSSINFNGQTYNGMNELPEDVRSKVQGAFDKLSEFGVVTNSSPMMSVQTPQVGREPVVTSRPLVSREYNPTIQEDKSNPVMMWIMIGLALMTCLAVAAIGIFLLLR